MQTNTQTPVRRLVESAIMVALAVVLSLIKLAELPYGGSVTCASMLPILIVAYRNGPLWGLGSGLVFSVVQLVTGLSVLSYVTGWQSVLAVILLDYIFAFVVSGLGGIFRKQGRSQETALIFGALLVSVLRFFFHVVSGATVWAGLSIPDGAALGYSLVYNATYMIPETIVTMIVGYYIGSVLDFRKTDVRRYQAPKESGVPALRYIAGLVIAAALVVVTALVFAKLQNAESGAFDITGLSAVNWTVVLIVSGAGVLTAAVLFILSKKLPAKKQA